MAKINNPLIVTGSQEKPEQTKSVTITTNGTQDITPDSGKVLSKVTIITNVPSKPEQEKSVTITKNGTTEVTPDNASYALSKVTVTTNVKPTLQAKTITPTKSTQNVTPDSSYDGLSKVTVNAIPDNYIIPSGSQDITTNGTYDITDKASVIVNVPATATEEKTVDLSMASGDQIIIPTSGKNLSKVTVTKPLTLLASNIKKDINIGGVIGTLEVPTLNTPSISLSSSILTITNPSTNGNFVTAFVILAQSSSTGLKTATTTVTTFDLSNLITEAGTYSITVKARGTGFNDSEESNTVTYTLQGQTTPAISLVNGTTIQIDTIDSNAQTIEVYADGTKIGEVSKQ